MRAAAIALLFLLLGVLASEPVLARKGFGQSGGRPTASGRVQSSPPSGSPALTPAVTTAPAMATAITTMASSGSGSGLAIRGGGGIRLPITTPTTRSDIPRSR